jgi:phosphoglycerate dehydrogenase-like enzyme
MNTAAGSKVQVLVSGIPYGFQGLRPQGRWLTAEQEARARSVPGVEVLHIGADDLARKGLPAGFSPEVLFVESGGDDEGHRQIPDILMWECFNALLTPKVRWIQVCSAGVEHLVHAIPEKVTLTNASGVHANAIAEMAILAMLAHAKMWRRRLEEQKKHAYVALPCRELRDSTVCVVGAGNIGREVARMSKALGMITIGVRREAHPTKGFDQMFGVANLAEALSRADYVVLACPLTPATHRILNAKSLQYVKPGAYLINVSRGDLADEAAMIDALRSGRLSGAYLDAFANEPLPANSPLWDLPTVTLTPHDAHASHLLGENEFDLFHKNLLRYVEGSELLNVVNRTLGY